MYSPQSISIMQSWSLVAFDAPSSLFGTTERAEMTSRESIGGLFLYHLYNIYDSCIRLKKKKTRNRILKGINNFVEKFNEKFSETENGQIAYFSIKGCFFLFLFSTLIRFIVFWLKNNFSSLALEGKRRMFPLPATFLELSTSSEIYFSRKVFKSAVSTSTTVGKLWPIFHTLPRGLFVGRRTFPNSWGKVRMWELLKWTELWHKSKTKNGKKLE